MSSCTQRKSAICVLLARNSSTMLILPTVRYRLKWNKSVQPICVKLVHWWILLSIRLLISKSRILSSRLLSSSLCSIVPKPSRMQWRAPCRRRHRSTIMLLWWIIIRQMAPRISCQVCCHVMTINYTLLCQSALTLVLVVVGTRPSIVSIADVLLCNWTVTTFILRPRHCRPS